MTTQQIEFLLSITEKHNRLGCAKMFGGEKYHTVDIAGSGKRTSYYDKTDDYENDLTRVGIKYTEGNDAPRGGKIGKYLQCDLASVKLSYEYHIIKGKRLTAKRIATVCAFFNITNYQINDDLSIDVNDHVSLSNRGVGEFPLKFNKVYGNFNCSSNNLTTLENGPKFVGGNFDASYNKLSSLQGWPKEIVGDAELEYNRINSTYVGAYDVDVKGLFKTRNCGLDDKLTNSFTRNYHFNDIDSDIIRLIFKYQRPFEIWNSDGSLNETNYQELIEEINNGLL